MVCSLSFIFLIQCYNGGVSVNLDSLFVFRFSFNRDDEAEMIEKIAADVSNKLNVTPSKDFDGMVGIEAHLRKVNSYLRLECDDVMMIGIQGPTGIGKTTIARALFNQLSANF